MTPRWPLTPLLLRSHVRLYPRITVSEFHGNISKCVDKVTIFPNFNKDYCILLTIRTTYYTLHTTYRMRDHIVTFLNKVQARQDQKKKKKIVSLNDQIHLHMHILLNGTDLRQMTYLSERKVLRKACPLETLKILSECLLKRTDEAASPVETLKNPGVSASMVWKDRLTIGSNK